MNKIIKILALSGFLFTTPAYAAANCGPAVPTRIITYSDGTVMLLAPWRGDWVTICSLNVDRGGVSPSTCFAWHATITNAITEGKSIYVYYYNINQSECTTMPTYAAAPVPGYIDFKNP